MPEETVSTSDKATRLADIKRRLQSYDEEKENGGREDGYSLTGSTAPGTSDKALDGAVSINQRRKATAKRDDGSSDSPFRPDGGSSTWHGGRLGSSVKAGAGAKRDSGARTQVDRQDAREETLLGSYWNKSVDIFKRALTYAGFDLKGDADALTDAEVERFRPQIEKLISSVGMGIDWALTHANKNHVESSIWEFTDDELAKLADMYLRRAKMVGWMAEVARQAEHLNEASAIGVDAKDLGRIIGLRVVESGMFIPDHGGWEPWIR